MNTHLKLVISICILSFLSCKAQVVSTQPSHPPIPKAQWKTIRHSCQSIVLPLLESYWDDSASQALVPRNASEWAYLYDTYQFCLASGKEYNIIRIYGEPILVKDSLFMYPIYPGVDTFLTFQLKSQANYRYVDSVYIDPFVLPELTSRFCADVKNIMWGANWDAQDSLNHSDMAEMFFRKLIRNHFDCFSGMSRTEVIDWLGIPGKPTVYGLEEMDIAYRYWETRDRVNFSELGFKFNEEGLLDTIISRRTDRI